METENNKTKSEEKKEDQQSNKQNTNANAGFDFSQLLNDKNIAEILKHLLSGAGAMAGNYFIWIKPLQDKIEAMTKTIEKQEGRIKELEEEQDEVSDFLFRDQNGQMNENSKVRGETNNDYFNLNKNINNNREFKRSRRVRV